jgi:hypothetical protein
MSGTYIQGMLSLEKHTAMVITGTLYVQVQQAECGNIT